MIYEVQNLQDAREFLTNSTKKVSIINVKGSTRYYGMRVIDYMLQTLKKEFTDKIEAIIIDADDDYSAFVTASNLKYKNIIFNNRLS